MVRQQYPLLKIVHSRQKGHAEIHRREEQLLALQADLEKISERIARALENTDMNPGDQVRSRPAWYRSADPCE